MQLADDDYPAIFPLRGWEFVQFRKRKAIEEQLQTLGRLALISGVLG